MRLDISERKALKYALEGFEGEVFLFGSRADDSKSGGDIDILLLPKEKTNPLKLSLQIQKKFFLKCEEDIDVVIYDAEKPFCRYVLSNAKRLDIARI